MQSLPSSHSIPDFQGLNVSETRVTNQKVVEIDIYNAGRVERVKAYTLDPYQVSTSYHNRLKPRRFREKQTTRIQVKGQVQSLYVKIKDLAAVLKIPMSRIPKEFDDIRGKNGTDFIIKHNNEQLNNLLRENGIYIHEGVKKRLIALADKVDYPTILDMLTVEDIDKTKLLYTLLAIGKELSLKKQDFVSQGAEEHYTYEAKAGEIFISISESTKLPLKKSSTNEENPSTPLISRKNSTIKRKGSTSSTSSESMGTTKIENNPETGSTKSEESEANSDGSMVFHSDLEKEQEECEKKIKETEAKAIQARQAKQEQEIKKAEAKEETQTEMAVSSIAKATKQMPELKLEVIFDDRPINNKKAKIAHKDQTRILHERFKIFSRSSDEVNNCILKLESIVGTDILVKLLGKLKSYDSQMRMLHTYHAIGYTLLNPVNQKKGSLLKDSWTLDDNQYIEGRLGRNFAFGIKGNKEFFIAIDPLTTGSFKDITDSFKLSEKGIVSFVRAKIKKCYSPDKLSASAIEKHNNILEDMQAEVRNLEKLHKHVKLKEYLTAPCEFKLIKPAKRGADQDMQDLIAFFPKHKSGIDLFFAPLRQQVSFLKGLAYGLATIHEDNKVHCDVKIQNVLYEGDFSSKKAIITKITDFGALLNIGDEVTSGTDQTLAPETMQVANSNIILQTRSDGQVSYIKPDTEASPAMDSFALGVIVLGLLTGVVSPIKTSLRGKKKDIIAGQLNQTQINEVLRRVEEHINLHAHFFKPRKKQARLELLDICKKLLTIDPKQRLDCLVAAQKLEKIEKYLY